MSSLPSEIVDLTGSDSPEDRGVATARTTTGQSQTGNDACDMDDIKYSLYEFLEEVKTFGAFATSGKIAGQVHTGLTIQNVGRIGFPLATVQAKQIIDVCHQAPFGRGRATVVDESVRKTWELNPDQFKVDAPEWTARLRQVTDRVGQELASMPANSIKASLYKLLLYEEGAHFKPHKDTEKEPRMFGTMVICLPSEYEGGAVATTYCGQTKRLEAEDPLYYHSYMAWFGDVTHEVKPITSGYRLVLVYNLINASSQPTESATHGLQKKEELKDIFRSWSNTIQGGIRDAIPPLVYHLDHQYTEASLNLGALKGSDHDKAECIPETCTSGRVCMYLGTLEKWQMCPSGDRDWDSERDTLGPGGYHLIDYVESKSLSIKRMLDLDGNTLAQGIEIKEAQIIQDDIYDGRDPDKEEYQGKRVDWRRSPLSSPCACEQPGQDSESICLCNTDGICRRLHG